jgi:23S rRNA (uridine2552-2'-O)-methyltransferase
MPEDLAQGLVEAWILQWLKTQWLKKMKWLERHNQDPYVKRAQAEGYRSRASFKLLEINQKDHLFKPGMRVVDLGAAPGGWSQVAAQQVGAKGQVIALDILPMDPVPGVRFIQGDFTRQPVLKTLLACLEQQPVNLVISDMAPNLTGNRITDQAQAGYLAELALDFAQQVLVTGGNFLIKVFQGEGFVPYVATLRKHFNQVKHRKPLSSKAQSRELYLLAQGFNAGT